MSKDHRRRGRCQACHEMCRSEPIEFCVRKTDGELTWSEWRFVLLCPPCRVAFEEIIHAG